MKTKNYYYSIYWISDDGRYTSDYDAFMTDNYQDALKMRQHFDGEKGYFTIFKNEKETDNMLREYTFKTK